MSINDRDWSVWISVKDRLPKGTAKVLAKEDEEESEHPAPKRKTYAEDFFEKFPKTNVKYLGKGNGNRLLGYCRDAIYKGEVDKNHCARCYCSACWNEEMEEQDE